MSVNSAFPNSSFGSAELHCANDTVSSLVGLSYIATRFLLFAPLSFFIFYLGFQKWQQQRRSISAASHSDIFTFHQCVLEWMWLVGTSLHTLLTYVGLVPMKTPGSFLSTSIFIGETSFHVLTCLDRYVAVVHPVVYRDLRNTRGVTFRNAAIVGVWLLCGLMSYTVNSEMNPVIFVILLLSLLILDLIFISFCSLCVLLALVGPGPGDAGGDKKHVDRTKQRACFTVTAILGVLCLYLMGVFVYICLVGSKVIGGSLRCVLETSVLWLSLPSSLILPLLYLHKTVKQPRGNQNKT